MSRTFRNKAYGLFGCIRKPKTHNEIMNITGIITDIKVNEYEDFPVSGINRMHRRKNIPTSWDDIHISSVSEWGT